MAKTTKAQAISEEPIDLVGKPSLDQSLKLNVLVGLGRPPRLHDVVVRPLWGTHYRVNVFVTSDASFVQMAHSYFVTVDDVGNILTSVPAIHRLYPE